jgi:hypothetical protein
MGLNIKAIEFDDNGNLVRAKGTFTKSKLWFSKITDKVMYWAELEIDYCGG